MKTNRQTRMEGGGIYSSPATDLKQIMPLSLYVDILSDLTLDIEEGFVYRTC